MSVTIGWQKADATSDQSSKKKGPTMALRDGSMWSSTPTGSEDRGASRLAAEVSGHYGALRIVAVRDGSMWSSTPTGCVRVRV